MMLKFNQLLLSCFGQCKRYKSCFPHVKSNEKNKLFLSAFPEVIDTLTTYGSCRNLPHFNKHFKELVEYTVLKERRFRPTVFIEAYMALESRENVTQNKLHLMTMLAWSIELIQTAMIVQDDTWDQTLMRGNDISWHKKPNIGLSAINDGVLLYEAAFILLKKYFSSRREYCQLMEIFHYMILMVAIGQRLDWQCMKDGKIVYEHFNSEYYAITTRHKGSAAVVEGPIMIALAMTEKLLLVDSIKDILIDFGHAFIVDNDILDVYDTNGKVRPSIGNDIREGKCTWLAIKILESNNKTLIEDFKQNYARSEPECEEKILEIYGKYKIYEQFCEYRRLFRNNINIRVEKMIPSLREAILSALDNVLPIDSF